MGCRSKLAYLFLLQEIANFRMDTAKDSLQAAATGSSSLYCEGGAQLVSVGRRA
ncbi:hypothetical protein HMPREF3198_00658 [Winkia neuii]|nr:hypothetical protein HMPREF3198_00658 [Winkia neuii]